MPRQPPPRASQDVLLDRLAKARATKEAKATQRALTGKPNTPATRRKAAKVARAEKKKQARLESQGALEVNSPKAMGTIDNRGGSSGLTPKGRKAAKPKSGRSTPERGQLQRQKVARVAKRKSNRSDLQDAVVVKKGRAAKKSAAKPKGGKRKRSAEDVKNRTSRTGMKKLSKAQDDFGVTDLSTLTRAERAQMEEDGTLPSEESMSAARSAKAAAALDKRASANRQREANARAQNDLLRGGPNNAQKMTFLRRGFYAGGF